jgi:uncharacterized protein
MKIIIAGGTGFIGQTLVSHFRRQNFEIAIIGRDIHKIKTIFGETVQPLTWAEVSDNTPEKLQGFDLIINLVGANISDTRWTPQRKQEILDSRIFPTEMLANICAKLGSKSPSLFNASGISIYGSQNPLHASVESEPIDDHTTADFLSKVAREWETATNSAKAASVRVINMRFAPVLGKNGGVLAKLQLPYLCFMGGRVGTGQQPFPWIALSDLCNAVDFLVAHPEIRGPVNFVAPQLITQRQFAKSLGKALHRPTFMTTPASILKFLFGEMADELLLHGQTAKPQVLLTHGFQFQYPEIDGALAMIYGQHHP